MIVFFRALFHIYKIVIYFFVVLFPNPESKVPVSSGIIWLVQHYSQCLKLCLARRRVFLNNLQRYDYSFLNVIGDKSEAEGGSVACPKSRDWRWLSWDSDSVLYSENLYSIASLSTIVRQGYWWGRGLCGVLGTSFESLGRQLLFLQHCQTKAGPDHFIL